MILQPDQNTHSAITVYIQYLRIEQVFAIGPNSMYFICSGLTHMQWLLHVHVHNNALTQYYIHVCEMFAVQKNKRKLSFKHLSYKVWRETHT